MYAILREDIALRAWKGVPRAYYVRGEDMVHGLGEKQFEIMRMCDGLQDIPESRELTLLLGAGMVQACEKGQRSLSEWQKLRVHENRYFPTVHWMLTQKCNYNCLHCFNCADNAPLHTEYAWEDAERLLDEIEACGVHTVDLTGGEPMLHPHFRDILQGLCDRGLMLGRLLTNGSFITPELLQWMKSLGLRPQFKISFDGAGHHDWMRGRKGAEQQALRAIRLCIEHDFPVMVQYNLNRRTMDALMDTARMLDAMGVQAMRILRTSESPRWKDNGEGLTLSMTEWHDATVDFMQRYAAEEHRMQVLMWMICYLDPVEKTYQLRPVRCRAGKFNEKLAMCTEVRRVACIAADGSLYPCMQAGVYLDQLGMKLGNVKEAGLKPLLTEGAYVDMACETIGQFLARNEKCRSCKYARFCAGGCRVCAMYLTGDPDRHDPHKCFFFENGYYDRFVQALPGYENITPIEEDDL